MIERLEFQVDIQIWPMKVMAMKTFNIEDFMNLGLFKPRVLIKGNEHLAFAD